MSATIPKRKRARKACIPCHQRKRKCDTEYPCGMCTTYDYNCRYTEDDITGTAGDVVDSTSQSKRISHSGRSRLTSRSHAEQSPHEVNGSSMNNPSVVASVSTGIFDEHKSRYAGASAAMAFPHILSAALGSDCPPKMRSFAYNFGIRPEETSNTHCLLGKLISQSDLGYFAGAYFAALAPIGDLLDARIFLDRCEDYYNGSGNQSININQNSINLMEPIY